MLLLTLACAPADQAYVVGASELVVEPSVLDFGEVAAGETAELPLLIENPDSRHTQVELELKGRGFTVERSSLELASGEQTELLVWFTPYGEQDANGELMVAAEDFLARVELVAWTVED